MSQFQDMFYHSRTFTELKFIALENRQRWSNFNFIFDAYNAFHHSGSCNYSQETPKDKYVRSLGTEPPKA